VKQPYSISVAQTCPVRGNVTANLSEHLQLAQLASEHGARLVLFPELSLTGYELDLADALALSQEDPRLDPLRDAACSYRLTIIAGAPVRLSSRLHIAAFIMDAQRGINLYTKQRLGSFGESARCDGTLPPPEPAIFEPGSLDPLLEFDADRAALAICADIGDVQHAQRAAARGATSYLASTFVIPSEFNSDSERLRGYATKHAMAIGLANFGRSTGGLKAAGRSSIWSEGGELLAQLPSTGTGIAVTTRSSSGWHGEVVMLEAGPAA